MIINNSLKFLWETTSSMKHPFEAEIFDFALLYLVYLNNKTNFVNNFLILLKFKKSKDNSEMKTLLSEVNFCLFNKN